MADAEENAKKTMSERADSWFARIGNYLVERISRFVTFLYVLIALGTVYGYYVIPRYAGYELYLLLLPLVIALLAYYNRIIAIVSFVLILLFFFVL